MELVIQIPHEAIIEGIKQSFAPLGAVLAERLMRVVEQEVPTDEPLEVSPAVARKVLAEKGYRVKSHVNLMATIKAHGVSYRKYGKEHIYNLRDLKKIPPRI
ncbi:MAG: hypothetical protein QM642_02000 [Edaphocola sp.]